MLHPYVTHFGGCVLHPYVTHVVVLCYTLMLKYPFRDGGLHPYIAHLEVVCYCSETPLNQHFVAAFFPPPFNHFSLFATQSVEASSPFDKGMLLPFRQGQLH